MPDAECRGMRNAFTEFRHRPDDNTRAPKNTKCRTPMVDKTSATSRSVLLKRRNLCVRNLKVYVWRSLYRSPTCLTYAPVFRTDMYHCATICQYGASNSISTHFSTITYSSRRTAVETCAIFFILSGREFRYYSTIFKYKIPPL